MKRSKEIKGVFYFFLFLILFFIFINNFFIYKVSGKSMSPTLNDGDIILVFKEKKCAVGDIVVFFSVEKGDNKKLVKRVEGRGGMYVSFEKGGKFINISEKKISKAYKIPKGFCFVVGDNFNYSFDSREGWLVNERLIIGKVVLRVYPFKLFF